MKKEVVGYKCFNKDHTNRYGMEFVVGRTYTSASSDVSFGNNNKSGYHMCKNLEDTFRYFPADSEEISVARVRGSGNIITRDDEYNGFYDMYSVERLHIDKFLTREEIIECKKQCEEVLNKYEGPQGETSSFFQKFQIYL